MPYLDLDLDREESRLTIHGVPSTGNMATSAAGELRESDPDGPALTEVPGRVLLIEPNSDERCWLRNELITGHMEVFEATDMISALRSLAMFRPNIILAQLRLPTYNGLELVRRLKRESATQSTPVLLYTDMASAGERIQALNLGASDLVSKPFVAAELIARLRVALRTRHLLTILEQRAHLDGLTGLANRGVLEDRLPREWVACRRRQSALAVMITDLDHFKAINDCHGHAAGDSVLRQSAALLARIIRASDLVARYGGEEFVVVAPDCEIGPAVRLAERFRTALAEHPIDENGIAISVTASVGVASVSDLTGSNPAELLKRADEALYQAKRAGRNATWYWEQGQTGPVPATDDVLATR